jgi:hypothetical protein
VSAEDLAAFIQGFPWQEEEDRFRARLPDNEPSPAGVTFDAPGHAEVMLRRPCRHLMEGDEHLGDRYSVIVTFPWRSRWLGLIPSPWTQAERQYWLPDMPTVLRLVELYLTHNARGLWDALDHGEFLAYEL